MQLNYVCSEFSFQISGKQTIPKNQKEVVDAMEASERKRYNNEIKPEIKKAKNQTGIIKTSFTVKYSSYLCTYYQF